MNSSRDVSVHIDIVYAVVKWSGSSKNRGVVKDKKKGAKTEVKGFIGSFHKVFGDTLVLTGLQHWVQVEIHIRGLSVWSMSRGITTAGQVSWQTGPGHWMVLKTSRHSYINRIKTSNRGFLASFECSGKMLRRADHPSKGKCSQGGERTQGGSWSWIWILFLKFVYQHKK